MRAIVYIFPALPRQSGADEMTAGGSVFAFGAWTGIISLANFCFSRVLRNDRKKW